MQIQIAHPTKIDELVTIVSKPWWTGRAIRHSNGLIEIARAHATSTTQRYHDDQTKTRKQVEEGMRFNPYISGTLAEGYHGKPVPYLLPLDQAMLDRLQADPLLAALPDDPYCGNTSKRRPDANTQDNPIPFTVAMAAQELVQNEGYPDEPIKDNTPWQKGDYDA